MNQTSEKESGKGMSTMKKWNIVGVVAAGIVLTGVSFGIMQGRATAGGSGRIAPVSPADAAGSGGAEDGVRQYASRGGCGSRCGQSVQRSCCSTPSGTSASGGGEALQVDPTLALEQYPAFLTDYYTKKLGFPVAVEVKDYGCHQEAEVTRDGKLVKRLSISGGYVAEIG